MSLQPQEFDLQPHPRILPMLGEINLSQASCFAELLDNSIDAFLTVQRANASVSNPEVHINIPTSDNSVSRISIRDNGPGMSAQKLENAVRAGWTGNDPINNLGMFGMGFNIATARLGGVTEVWTTQSNSKEWYGLKIDFEQLANQKHFKTPILTRAKPDPHKQGTEVTIERLKPEQRTWFSKQHNRSKLMKDLGKIYSAMLRGNGVPISFKLSINGTQVQGRNHCIFGGEGNPERQVPTSSHGIVNAYQPINTVLGERPFCAKCWQWLAANEKLCPMCNSVGFVIVRQRRVYGWLGIQRYLSSTNYGIDFLRHGRKIEIANTDLFHWNDGETREKEYPIDDPNQRGRIVGEIHIDHCRVTYTKDRFDRNDPAWDEMIGIVRGRGPLRPTKASALGYASNLSPLFMLYQVFRRSSPKPKFPGCYQKLLVVPQASYELAEEMAERFFNGEAEYIPDTKWWDLIQEGDNLELLKKSGSSSDKNDKDVLSDLGVGSGDESEGDLEQLEKTNSLEEKLKEIPPRSSVPSLSQLYRDDQMGQWEVRAYSVSAIDEGLVNVANPWALTRTTAGHYEFLFQERHEVFRSATLTPLDALLAEIAWSAMDFERGNQSSQMTFARVLSSLRNRYALAAKLDPMTLIGEATLTLAECAKAVCKNISAEDSLPLFGELSLSERDAINQKLAMRAVPNPQQIISNGRFLEFAPYKTLLSFFKNHPELFFDAKVWDVPYTTLDYGSISATDEAKQRVVRHHESLLTDTIWLAEQETTDISNAGRARVLRALLAIEILDSSICIEDNL